MINSTQKNRIIKFFPPSKMKDAFLLSDDELLNQIPKYLNKFQFLNAFRFSSFALDIVDTLFKPEMNKNQAIKNMLNDLPKELR